MSGSAAIDAGASDQRRSVVSPDQRKLMTLSLQEVHTSSHIDFGTVHWWGIVDVGGQSDCYLLNKHSPHLFLLVLPVPARISLLIVHGGKKLFPCILFMFMLHLANFHFFFCTPGDSSTRSDWRWTAEKRWRKALKHHLLLAGEVCHTTSDSFAGGLFSWCTVAPRMGWHFLTLGKCIWKENIPNCAAAYALQSDEKTFFNFFFWTETCLWSFSWILSMLS